MLEKRAKKQRPGGKKEPAKVVEKQILLVGHGGSQL
jgi:hypothetical protein